MKKQVEDTHLSQAVTAAQDTVAYDTNVKFLLAEKEYGMIMTVEIEGRMQAMCNLSEGILEEGRAEGIIQGISQGEILGDLRRSRQVIFDLLEDLGDIPEDICAHVHAQEDTEILRRWHKAAARAESFAAFREILAWG